jgi:hypothetical protein
MSRGFPCFEPGVFALAWAHGHRRRALTAWRARRSPREAAPALFLSPKTIEYYLRHVYQKLGIGCGSSWLQPWPLPHREQGDRPPEGSSSQRRQRQGTHLLVSATAGDDQRPSLPRLLRQR